MKRFVFTCLLLLLLSCSGETGSLVSGTESTVNSESGSSELRSKKEYPGLYSTSHLKWRQAPYSREYSNAQGLHCLMVLGTKKDEKGAFNHERYAMSKGPTAIGGTVCEKFDGWEQMWDFIQSDEVGEKDKLLILHLSHGEYFLGNVSFHCNVGIDSDRAVFEVLNLLASRRKIFLMMQACFSGNLLERKLEWDRKNPDSQQTQNLCVATSTSFNQSGASGYLLDLLAVKPGRRYHADDLFLLSQRGVISSAAWESVNITQLNANPEAVFQRMARLSAYADGRMVFGPHSSDLTLPWPTFYARLGALPLASSFDDLTSTHEVLEDGYQSYRHPLLWGLSRWQDDLRSRVVSAGGLSGFFGSTKLDPKYESEALCARAYRDWAEKETVKPLWKFVADLADFIDSSPARAACKKAGLADGVSLFRKLQKYKGNPPPKLPVDSWSSGVWNYRWETAEYFRTLERLEPLVGDRIYRMAPHEALSLATTEGNSDNGFRKQLAKAFFGAPLPKSQSFMEYKHGLGISPNEYMTQEFVVGSLYAPTLPHPLDNTRREACRSFEIGESEGAASHADLSELHGQLVQFEDGQLSENKLRQILPGLTEEILPDTAFLPFKKALSQRMKSETPLSLWEARVFELDIRRFAMLGNDHGAQTMFPSRDRGYTMIPRYK